MTNPYEYTPVEDEENQNEQDQKQSGGLLEKTKPHLTRAFILAAIIGGNELCKTEGMIQHSNKQFTHTHCGTIRPSDLVVNKIRDLWNGITSTDYEL